MCRIPMWPQTHKRIANNKIIKPTCSGWFQSESFLCLRIPMAREWKESSSSTHATFICPSRNIKVCVYEVCAGRTREHELNTEQKVTALSALFMKNKSEHNLSIGLDFVLNWNANLDDTHRSLLTRISFYMHFFFFGWCPNNPTYKYKTLVPFKQSKDSNVLELRQWPTNAEP